MFSPYIKCKALNTFLQLFSCIVFASGFEFARNSSPCAQFALTVQRFNADLSKLQSTCQCYSTNTLVGTGPIPSCCTSKCTIRNFNLGTLGSLFMLESWVQLEKKIDEVMMHWWIRVFELETDEWMSLGLQWGRLSGRFLWLWRLCF